MREGLRQTMAWVHTWAGLACGWLLCAIFLTGSLSVFREPITRWMTARPAVAAPAGATSIVPADEAVGRAAAYLEQAAPEARLWRIQPPQQPGDALLLAWRTSGGLSGEQQAALDPHTGEVLPQPWGRKTEGGRHFMTFHYSLHGGNAGFWVVGWVAMCALVALGSGVIVHRRIFADFFTFRPGKGQRSWLDAHNATAVLTLPFLFVIVYTGVAFFYSSYMPWPLRAAYDGPGAHARYQGELSATPAGATARPQAAADGATLVPLPPLVRTAQSRIDRPARMVIVQKTGNGTTLVRVFGSTEGPEAEPTVLNPAGLVDFDGATGEVLRVQRPESPREFATEQIHSVILALHVVTFGGWGMKWLYFLSGLLGTAMIATGTVLFMVKRRARSGHEFGALTPAFYRLVEAMNTAAMAGICVASIGYLYANRLLPADLAGRDRWEIRAFLIVWALTLLHAGLRPPLRAWVEQFGVAAVLCLALPLLNLATTGQHLLSYAARGDSLNVAVEATTLALGALMAWIAWRVHRRQRVTA